MFITFEGVEGCGKSTQIKLLAEALAAKGANFLATHEPGGTEIGAAIRKILLTSGAGPMSPMAELLLFSAARAELVAGVIRPALAQGKIVLCDRFYDSTMAYQGHARGLDKETVRQLTRIATGGLTPDRTILLDLPAETGLDRATTRMFTEKKTEARFEEEGIRFHKLVQEGFYNIAMAEPDRVKLVDAMGPVEEVRQRVGKAVGDILPLG